MKQWYVIQVYAGYEELVKTDILKRIEEQQLAERFGDILIPSAKMRHMFDGGEEGEQDQQLFPGYMLIEMESVPEAVRLVMVTPRVMRFLGGATPTPISRKEIDRIQGQMRGEVTIAVEQQQFEIGKEIEVRDGAFAGFVGIIDSVDEASEKLIVMVSIFGRMTPVELGFDQVKR